MLSKILYYTLLKPLSLLPFRVLYMLSDLAYVVVYHILGYRKAVVRQNLRNSFPQKTAKELKHIEGKFYHHLCDLAVESIKIFSISLEEAVASNRFVNPEVADRFYDEGRSVIFSAGHYNNWEMCVLASDAQIKHKSIGVYTPLANPFFEEKMRETRGKYGMVLLPKRQIKEFHASNRHVLTGTILASDQAPSPSTKQTYTMTFLNQETEVMYGTEKFAREYNYPVLFAAITKVRRGVYETRFEVVEEEPSSTPYGQITEKVTRLLEKQILDQPEFWLWTHKRWKKRNKLKGARTTDLIQNTTN